MTRKDSDRYPILASQRLSLEEKAVALCVRQEFSSDDRETLARLCAGGDIRWELVFELSADHKVSALVYHNLQKSEVLGLSVPRETHKKFAEWRRRNLAQKEVWYRNARRAARLCGDMGYHVMLSKGIALDLLVYKDRSYICYGDVDLIVKEKNYHVSPEKRDEIHWFAEEHDMEIDYYAHHDVDMDRVISVNFNRIWADARTIAFFDADVYVMAPEDMLIAACVSACRKRFDLRHLCDISEIIRTYDDIDWRLFLDKSSDHKCDGIVYAGLSAAHWVLGCDAPPAYVREELKVSRARRAFFDGLFRNMFSLAPNDKWKLEVWNRELRADLLLPYASYDWRMACRRMAFLPGNSTNTEPGPNTEPAFKAQLEEGRRLGMADRPRPASDTRLHLVDDAGVLFSERSRDLYVLNATAAFVWCCLEDGLERDRTVDAVAQAYGVPAAAAASQVDALLRRWEELGLLAGTVRNRGRRARPDEEEPEDEEPDGAPWPGDAPAPSHSERCYRLLTTVFRVRYATAAQEEVVHPVLAHLEASPPVAGPATTAVDLFWDGAEHALVIDGRCEARCGPLDELAPVVKGALLAGAINSYRYLLYVHAGVVGGPRGCLLLPAAPGSGKSSLTAALVRTGFTYLSDEVALLEEDTLRVRPVPVSLCVKEGAWELLAPRYPELRGLAVHHRWDDKVVRYLNPPPAALDPEPERSHPVRWIVFPKYTPRARTELRPLRRADALHRLLEQCLAVPAPLDHAKLAALVEWIGEIPCFEMPMSSLDKAVALLDGLCRGEVGDPAQAAS